MTARQLLSLFVLVTSLLPTAATADDVIEYYGLDALGNVRLITDENGNVIERHDYYPFGEECTTGPCASNPGAGAGQPRKFTGKERDTETGFDYFGARYYGSKIGRFTTVDPVYTWNDNLLDPQRWNRYSYVRNSPFRYVDPDGRGIASKAVKLIVKGGDVAATFADVAQDAAVLFSPDPAVGTVARLGAVASLVSEGAPISIGDVKHGIQGLKRVPNPFGRKGGLAHQAKAADVAAEIEGRGLIVGTEYMVPTPGAEKRARFVDIVGIDSTTGDVVEMHQVGKQTKAGLPVARERRAIGDVKGACGTEPCFHPYNEQ